MDYVKGTLIASAAVFIAFAFSVLPELSSQKQTGVGAMVGGFSMLLFSPWMWLLMAVCSLAFFWASRLHNTPGRILLFWIPTITFSTLLLGISVLFCVVLPILSSRTP